MDNLLENSAVIQLVSQAMDEIHVLLPVLSGSSLSSIKADRGLCLCVISTCTPIWQSMASVFVLVGYMKLSVNRSVNEPPPLLCPFYRNIKNTVKYFFRHPIKRALVSDLCVCMGGWMCMWMCVPVQLSHWLQSMNESVDAPGGEQCSGFQQTPRGGAGLL